MFDAVMRRNFGSLLLLQGSNYVIPLLVFPYLARTLGPDHFGQLGFAQAVIGYLVLLTDWGFALSAVQQVAQHRDDRAELSRIFWSTCYARAGLLIASLLFLILLCLLVDKFGRIWPLLFAWWIFVVGSALTPAWFLQGIEALSASSRISIFAKVLTLPAIFLLVKGPQDVWLAALVQGIALIIGAVLSLYLIWRMDVVDFFRPTLREAFQRLHEAWELFASTASISLYTTSNAVILGFLTNSLQVGYFNGADKLRSAAQGLINPISQVIYPRVSALMVDSHARAYALLRRVLLVQGGITLGISLLLYAAAEPIVSLLLGPGFEQSVCVVRVLAPMPFLIGLSNIFGIQIMIPIGMKRVFSQILLASGVINVALAIPLSWQFGATGTAFSVLFTEAIVTIVMIWVLWQQSNPIFSFRGTPS